MWAMDEAILFFTLVFIITRALVVEEKELMVKHPVIKHEAWKNNPCFWQKDKKKNGQKNYL